MIALEEVPPATGLLAGHTAVSFTLHVADVPRAVAFYRTLFDREPTKHFHEYAEYLLPEPAVALGLLHVNPYPGKPTHAIGWRLAGPEELDAVRDRLELAGIALRVSFRDRLTLNDPDNNRLDLYLGEPDLSPLEDIVPPARIGPNDGSTWEHKICTPLPSVIPHTTASLDRVTLQGTFNSRAGEEEIAALLAEVRRVLKPGGRVMVTGLVGDRPPPQPLALPGLASRIQSLPLESTPMIALQRAGFVDIHYELLGDIICFQAPGVDLRKIRLFGTRPEESMSGDGFTARYLGPLAEVETDDGQIFRRGELGPVDRDTARRLQAGPARAQFAVEVFP